MAITITSNKSDDGKLKIDDLVPGQLYEDADGDLFVFLAHHRTPRGTYFENSVASDLVPITTDLDENGPFTKSKRTVTLS